MRTIRAARRKIRSDRGASLSMALLLFLVCAAVGAIALAAGTAAAGRVSRMAEMDRRYHSVSSAARLLAQKLSNETVTLVRTKSTDTIVKEINQSDGEDPPNVEVIDIQIAKVSTYHTALNDTALPDVQASSDDGTEPVSTTGASMGDQNFSLLTGLVVKMVYGSNNCNTDAAMSYTLQSGNYTAEIPFSLTHEAAGLDAEALTVQGTIRPKVDGTLVVTVQDAREGDRYTLTVTLEPHYTEKISTHTQGNTGHQVTNTEDGFIESTTSTAITTITSTVYWTVQSIQ